MNGILRGKNDTVRFSTKLQSYRMLAVDEEKKGRTVKIAQKGMNKKKNLALSSFLSRTCKWTI